MKRKTFLQVQYVIFILLMPVAAYLGYCTFFRSCGIPLPPDRSKVFNSKNASIHLKTIKSLRGEESQAGNNIYKYLRRDLLTRGLKVTEFFITQKDSGIEMKSLAGIVPGETREMLIISTHYDFLHRDGMNVNEGADLALALELSRVFSMKKHHFTFWFLFLDGESRKEGKSSCAAEQLIEMMIKSGELAQVKAFISLDLPACTVVDVACQEHSSGDLLSVFRDTVVKAKKEYLYKGRTVDSSGDFLAFQMKGIPSIELLDEVTEKVSVSSSGAPAPDGSYHNLWALGTVLESFITVLDSKMALKETRR